MVVFEKALHKWGADVQASMTMGECGELIASLNRYFVQGRMGEREAVIDEIADVKIMIEQMTRIFGVEEVETARIRKLARLEKILDGEVNHPHS